MHSAVPTVRRLLAVLVLTSAVLAGATPVAAASVAGERPQRTVTFDVQVRGSVQADIGAFARVAQHTFNDRRGWSLGGSLRFVQVPSGGAFTLWLASPAAMTSFSSVCSAQYSCRVGRDVIINDQRWRTGTATWPAVREYRRYVLNHELGHWLGLGHVSCPGSGAAAPVMQQQSIGLGGCRTTTWPLEGERRAAAARMGVTSRPTAAPLVGVDRLGSASTEVHVVEGATRYASFLAQSGTALPAAVEPYWTFRLADYDRDGISDLFAVEHSSRSFVRVQVIGGASGYRTSLLNVVTPLRLTDQSSWAFDVADLDGDGHLDLAGVNGQGESGTEVHVLSGAAGLRAWQINTVTALARTASPAWSFAFGDHDRDGVPDLYAIARQGASGRTEMHVLSGADGFRSWLANVATPLGPTRPVDWSFDVGDADGNGRDDLLAVLRGGASGHTELHVLDRSYTRWQLHAVTPLPPTTGQSNWSFDLAG